MSSTVGKIGQAIKAVLTAPLKGDNKVVTGVAMGLIGIGVIGALISGHGGMAATGLATGLVLYLILGSVFRYLEKQEEEEKNAKNIEMRQMAAGSNYFGETAGAAGRADAPPPYNPAWQKQFIKDKQE